MDQRPSVFLRPATKLGQGNILRSVCQEFCSQRGLQGGGWGWVGLAGGCLQAHTWGEGWGVWPGGSPSPHPGMRLRCLALNVIQLSSYNNFFLIQELHFEHKWIHENRALFLECSCWTFKRSLMGVS